MKIPLVVIGAPLVIDGAAFRPADADLFPTLKRICDEVHRAPVGRPDEPGTANENHGLHG